MVVQWDNYHNDTSGKLRRSRSESTLTGYYFNSGVWVNIHSFAFSDTSDDAVHFRAWSYDSTFAHKEVKVAFDNFIVNQGQLVWPTTSQT